MSFRGSGWYALRSGWELVEPSRAKEMLDQLTSRTAIFFVKGEDQMEKLVALQNSPFPRAKVVAVKEMFI
jgi:hypothetical protein